MNLLYGLGFIRRGYKVGKSPAGNNPEEKPAFSADLVTKAKDWKQILRRVSILPAVMLVGFQSGLFGIGGGMMYSIFLMLCLSFPTLKATGTAMVITFSTTIIAALGIYYQIPANAGFDRRTLILLLMMIFCSMSGTILGARVAYSLSLRRLNYLIASVIILASLIALIQNLIISP